MTTIETSDLLALAQIAVALAGFSAVIGVLGSRSSRAELRVDALRLQVMLETGLQIAAFALLPVLVAGFGASGHATWRISAALWLVCAVPVEILALRRTRKMRDMTLMKINVNSVNWALALAADLIMLVVALDLIEARARPLYLLALFVYLVMAGLLFVQFAASTFVPTEASDPARKDGERPR